MFIVDTRPGANRLSEGTMLYTVSKVTRKSLQADTYMDDNIDKHGHPAPLTVGKSSVAGWLIEQPASTIPINSLKSIVLYSNYTYNSIIQRQ